MLSLPDLFPFSQVGPLVAELLASGPGLTIVAGFDPPPGENSEFLPTGWATVFRTLFDDLFTNQPKMRCTLIASGKDFLHPPRGTAKRFSLALVEPPLTYTHRITEAITNHPGLLLLDRLDAETIPLALEGARNGLRVLAPMNTVLFGSTLVRALLNMGTVPHMLSGLGWIVAVQRVATLCPHCKALLSVPGADGNTHYQAPGCSHCRGTGRLGDAGIVDIFCADAPPAALTAHPSRLSIHSCLAELAHRGQLSANDVASFQDDQLRRTFALLTNRVHLLNQATLQTEMKRTELEAANRVLRHRTEALFSLEQLSLAITNSDDLHKLGEKICQQAGVLCGADRAVVYFQHSDDRVVVLAVTGWDQQAFPPVLNPAQVFTPQMPLQPIVYNRCPPGFPHSIEEQKLIRAGLAVPLVAQDRRVGLMVVHSTRKPQFAPGEVALMQTFTNQAAVALQRAGLVDQLQRKVEQLEAAQVELSNKERLERELELARQVQQSMIPRMFPLTVGCKFAASNEPARQVGGDFYDVFPLPEDRVGLVIADVSDKGMPAALYMTLTRSLLRAEASQNVSPAVVLRQLNRLLLELGDPNMFVTLFYAVLDPIVRRLTYCRAGHNRPLLLRRGVASELGGKGMALGVFDNDMLVFSEEHLPLEPGDRVVLFTDGLTDALCPSGQMFDLQGLQALLLRCADQPIEDLCQDVFAEIAAFRGSAEPFDDMAMLALEMTE